MDHYTRNVLVVEPNPVERERLAAALEGTGFQVLECSGPVAPDYTCVGARSGRCPLASDESVVVIDTDLNSDAAVSGTSAEELLGFYLEGGHRVVTLGPQPMRCDDDRVLQLRRHPETDELLAAVWWSAAPTPPALRPSGEPGTMPELAGATKARSRGGAALRPVPDGLSEPGRPTQVAAAALADDEG